MSGDEADADGGIVAGDPRVDLTHCYRHRSGGCVSAMPDPIRAGFWIPIVIVGGVSSKLPGRTKTQGDALQVAMAHLDCA
jgi:hypothetical protein